MTKTRTTRLIAIALAAAPVAVAATQDVHIQEWSTPTRGAHPHDPAVAPDGSLWYTGQHANVLGRLDPKLGKIREYPLTTPDSGPRSRLLWTGRDPRWVDENPWGNNTEN